MGLAICRSIVEAHGGSLTVSPGISHGSVFQIALPIARQKWPGGLSSTTSNAVPAARSKALDVQGPLSSSVWTVYHIHPVAARGLLDHLHRCPSDFDILSIGALPAMLQSGSKTDVSVFVDMAYGQLDRQLQFQVAHECLFDVIETLNRLPWFSHEYAYAVLQQ